MPGSLTNKILFLPSWYPNKSEHASGNFIKRLIETDSAFDDVAVLFVMPDATRQKGYEIHVNNKEGFCEIVIYYPKVSGGPPSASIRKIIRRFNAYRTGMKELSRQWGSPQLVHVQSAFYALLYAWWLKIWKGIPYILTEHGITNYISKPLSLSDKVLFFWLKCTSRQAKRIITVSKYLTEAMRGRGFKNKYTVIPNVVPLPELLPEITPPADKKRMLHISTLLEVKNVKGILRAIKQVSLSRRDFELVIVGEDEQQKELIEYSRTLGLYNNFVKFRGYIRNTDELVKLILSSNFMVMFSHYETFSIVLAESLWAGRPVITSKCGGPQEFITEEFGVQVTPGDEKELAQAINKMLDTYQSYDTKKMRAFARENFAPAVIGRKIHSIHSEIISSTSTIA